MFRDLFRPFLYLFIRHPGNLMAWLNWVLPVLLSAAMLGLVYWVAPTVNLFASEGLLSKLLSFVQSLPGFYIAALAAVATFQQPSLDNLMAGAPPKVDIVYNGELTEVSLTRRRFLCLMFSYLTAISFLLTFALVAVTSLAGPVRDVLLGHCLPQVLEVIRWAISFALIAGTVQMLVVTFFGLYYLGERMHTPDL